MKTNLLPVLMASKRARPIKTNKRGQGSAWSELKALPEAGSDDSTIFSQIGFCQDAVRRWLVPPDFTEWIDAPLLGALALHEARCLSVGQIRLQTADEGLGDFEAALQVALALNGNNTLCLSRELMGPQTADDGLDDSIATLAALIYGCAAGRRSPEGSVTSLVARGRGKLETNPHRIRLMCSQRFEKLKSSLANVFESVWNYRHRDQHCSCNVPLLSAAFRGWLVHNLRRLLLHEAEVRIRLLVQYCEVGNPDNLHEMEAKLNRFLGCST